MEPLDSDDDAAEDLAAERRALHELVATHGGSVLASPGVLVYAAFGTTRAHDDDPQRALNAWRMAFSRRLVTRAGLATGQGAAGRHRPYGRLRGHPAGRRPLRRHRRLRRQ